MTDIVTILALESSCDDTCAAVVRARVAGGAAEGPGEILSNVVLGQEDLHRAYGGVVPEIAARAHAEMLDIAVERALEDAAVTLAEIDFVAATAGPGLIGGVLSGVMCAKGIAFGAGKPLIGVNHLEGHALTPRLTDGMANPYLLLLVSGGHCQLLHVEAPGRYRRLGGSIDDAPGEAFDKVAKLLGLGYPGGPEVEREARAGDPERFAFPRPLMDREGCDMSFSGLKTAVLRARNEIVSEKGGISARDRADLCASFQAAARDVLAEKTRRAMEMVGDDARDGGGRFAVAGGVAANKAIRSALQAVCEEGGFAYSAPPLKLCTDNAAMIAWAAAEAWARGERGGSEIAARPRWPLDEAAAPMLGGGRKGARA
ncbi:MAG: tRNA (adenosine(37)-N6)-threonylcarbamoyltransferase complex transferase subunit TsaD [Pseudomonadota bacterium]